MFHQLSDPAFHFTRSLIGKGHRRDIAGFQATLLNQIADFAGDNTGFATASAGKN